jgi:inhibitor of KinA sporulation pathway (predicted exonuclease)
MHYLDDWVLVVDLEATCWLGHPPDGQRSEVIEIGVAALDLATLEIVQHGTRLIRPTDSEISPFCTELTHITPQMVEAEGVTYAEACQWLKDTYQTDRRLWVSWGSDDLKMMQRECDARQVQMPFSPYHQNLKRIYAKATKTKHGLGLVRTLESIGLTFEGTAHRGRDDAYNTARIARWLVQNYTVGVFSRFLPKNPPPQDDAV